MDMLKQADSLIHSKSKNYKQLAKNEVTTLTYRAATMEAGT